MAKGLLSSYVNAEIGSSPSSCLSIYFPKVLCRPSVLRKHSDTYLCLPLKGDRGTGGEAETRAETFDDCCLLPLVGPPMRAKIRQNKSTSSFATPLKMETPLIVAFVVRAFTKSLTLTLKKRSHFVSNLT
jgi:hypothetical protein